MPYYNSATALLYAKEAGETPKSLTDDKFRVYLEYVEELPNPRFPSSEDTEDLLNYYENIQEKNHLKGIKADINELEELSRELKLLEGWI